MCDSTSDWTTESVKDCLKNFIEVEELIEPTIELINDIATRLIDIDYKITRASRRWSVARMARLDRSILRVAVYELITSGELSLGITINESLELGRKYGSEESPHFINGILDRVAVNDGLKNSGPAEVHGSSPILGEILGSSAPLLVPIKVS